MRRYPRIFLTSTRFGRHRFLSLALVLLVMLGLGNPLGSTAAPTVASGPVLNAVTAASDLPDIVTVAGHGFTPGGRVYVALYDQWGVALFETRWIIASERYFQPPLNLGSGGDLVFDTGGAIAEAFLIETPVLEVDEGSQQQASVGCTATLMARAYDEATATWSPIVDLVCLA